MTGMCRGLRAPSTAVRNGRILKSERQNTMSDNLPPMPELSYLGEGGESNYGYDAEDMRDYARAAIKASRAAVPAGTDVQWQKRHPLRTEGAWENTHEHDAKWWRDHSQGWEIRVLYAHPITQAKPEQAAQPKARTPKQLADDAVEDSKFYFNPREALTPMPKPIAAPQPKD